MLGFIYMAYIRGFVYLLLNTCGLHVFFVDMLRFFQEVAFCKW